MGVNLFISGLLYKKSPHAQHLITKNVLNYFIYNYANRGYCLLMDRSQYDRGPEHSANSSFGQDILCRDSITYVDSRWVYKSSDPIAVDVIFNPHAKKPIIWTFGRDLPKDGLEMPAGEGDVKFEPISHREIMMTLINSIDDDEPTTLWVPRLQLARFVLRTYKMVPKDKEDQLLKAEVEEAIRKIPQP